MTPPTRHRLCPWPIMAPNLSASFQSRARRRRRARPHLQSQIRRFHSIGIARLFSEEESITPLQQSTSELTKAPLGAIFTLRFLRFLLFFSQKATKITKKKRIRPADHSELNTLFY